MELFAKHPWLIAYFGVGLVPMIMWYGFMIKSWWNYDEAGYESNDDNRLLELLMLVWTFVWPFILVGLLIVALGYGLYKLADLARAKYSKKKGKKHASTSRP